MWLSAGKLSYKEKVTFPCRALDTHALCKQTCVSVRSQGTLFTGFLQSYGAGWNYKSWNGTLAVTKRSQGCSNQEHEESPNNMKTFRQCWKTVQCHSGVFYSTGIYHITKQHYIISHKPAVPEIVTDILGHTSVKIKKTALHGNMSDTWHYF